MMPDTKAVLIGFSPRQIGPCPDMAAALGVEEVCSVSTCIAKGPTHWINFWRHNDLWLFSSPDLAWSVVPQTERLGFRLFACQLFPIRVNEPIQTDFPIPDLNVEPPDETFISLGYDVVCRPLGTEFGCSPLSCKQLA